VIGLSAILCPAQEIQFKSDDVKVNFLQVADHYARSGEFQNAVMQYYEYMYRFPDDSLEPNIMVRIAAVYQASGKLQLAEEYYHKAAENYAHTKFDLENRLRLAVFLYEKGDYDAAIQFALLQREMPFLLVEIYSWLMLHEIEVADSLVADLPADMYRAEFIPEYVNLRKNGVPLKWTRKMGAYLFSALLPGSGRILMEEYKDGIFTGVGFYGMVKLSEYTLQHQPAFYFYSITATLVYYGLNLYATHNTVQQYGDRVMDETIQKLIRIYPLSQQLRLDTPY